jgi:hypothetical protein
MVERIIAESNQRLCYGADYFVVWGLYSGSATLTFQLIDNGKIPVWTEWIVVALLAVAIAYSWIRGARARGTQPRRSIVQREFFNVLWLATGLAFVVNVLCFNLFSGWGQAAIWSFAESIVLLYIGIHGNRTAQVAAGAVVASMILANFVPSSVAGYVLAVGMVAGYSGFGVVELLARD